MLNVIDLKIRKLLLIILPFLYTVVLVFSSANSVNAAPTINGLEDFNSPTCGSYPGVCKHIGCYSGHTGYDVCLVPGCFVTNDVKGPTIYAAAPGVVIANSFDAPGFGNYVAVEHTLTNGSKLYSFYAHLYSTSVTVGSQVTKETPVGIMGKTGVGSNNIVHLHFEIRKELWNPSSYIDPTFVMEQKLRTEDCTTLEQAPDNGENKEESSQQDENGQNNNQEDEQAKTDLSNVESFTTEVKSWCYKIPEHYDMQSCQKIVVNNKGVDTIIAEIEVPECTSGGVSEKNNQLPCNKEWLVAYMETVSVENFPLLKFFSAIAPTEDNEITPICFTNINWNVSNSFKNYVPINFTNEYPGLLRFSGSRGTVDVSYPRIGTAVTCAMVDFRDVRRPLYLDVQSFNHKLPKVVDEKVAEETNDDSWWTKLIDFIKDLNIFSQSTKKKEADQIKTIAQIMSQTISEELNEPLAYRDTTVSTRLSGLEEMCSDLIGKPIAKVNISDDLKAGESRDSFVVNRDQELKQLDHTELCDLQYMDGRVYGAKCTMNNGEIFDMPAGSSVMGGGSLIPKPYEIVIGYDPDANPITECVPSTICGTEVGCSATYADVYKSCRGSDTVALAEKHPKVFYKLNEAGYDELIFPAGNKLLEKVVNSGDQINSPYAVLYGENIGIKINSEHQIYDLNSKNKAYSVDGSSGPDYDVNSLRTPFFSSISYEKIPYNYYIPEDYKGKYDGYSSFFSSGFKPVIPRPIKSQFYYPYLGQIPRILERLAVIHTNANNPETNCALNSSCRGSIFGTSTTNEALINDESAEVLGLFNWNKDVSQDIKDPQLNFCSEQAEDRKGIDDCYVGKNESRNGDPIRDYLCSVGLEYDCDCETDDEPGGIIENNCAMGNIAGKVGWPSDPARVVNTTCIAGFNCDTTHSVGFDIATGKVQGVPIYAVADGMVVFVRDGYSINCWGDKDACAAAIPFTSDEFNGWHSGYGNVIGIKHADGISVYAHNENGSAKVKVGDCVTKGQHIANIGSVGNSSGEHIHFELRKLNCTAYTADCMLHVSNAEKDFGGLFDEAPSGNENDDESTGGAKVKNYCLISHDPKYSGVGPKSENIACLIKNAVDSINSSMGGYYVSPEIVYAILKGESGFRCNNSDSTMCNTGDPNQISNIIPWICWNNPGYPCDDGVGLSQSLSGVFNKTVGGNLDAMYACKEYIGTSTSDGNDSLSSNSAFSRKRVGDAICYVALYGANVGKRIGFNESDRKDVNKGMIIAEDYTCPSQDTWCARADQNYRPALVYALDSGIMLNCKTE